MERVEFDDVEVTFAVQGSGERLVLVHASAFVSWYDPLIERLTDVATLRYRRRLRKPEGGAYRPLSAAEDAASCARLMDHVGWPAAHVAGHSYGALVALQMALDAPARVASVALLEPAARGIASSAQIAAALAPVAAAYKAGDTVGAVDTFLRHVCGDGYREVLDRVLPGAFGEAVAEADLFFQAEMPAVQCFSFGASDADECHNPCSTCSAPRAPHGSSKAASSSSRGSRAPSACRCPRPGIC